MARRRILLHHQSQNQFLFVGRRRRRHNPRRERRKRRSASQLLVLVLANPPVRKLSPKLKPQRNSNADEPSTDRMTRCRMKTTLLERYSKRAWRRSQVKWRIARSARSDSPSQHTVELVLMADCFAQSVQKISIRRKVLRRRRERQQRDGNADNSRAICSMAYILARRT